MFVHVVFGIFAISEEFDDSVHPVYDICECFCHCCVGQVTLWLVVFKEEEFACWKLTLKLLE